MSRLSKPKKAVPPAPKKAPPPKPPAVVADVPVVKAAPLGKTSDEDLMRRTQQGDRQAYSILYERYNQAILSFLFRMLGNVEDVEAIGQEVFLRAFRFAPTYRYPQKLSTWLFTIARNLAINNARRKKRSPIRSFTALNIENAENNSDPDEIAVRGSDDVEKREQIALVLKAMDTLPPDQKEVIMMGIFQDLSYAEMEEITGAKAVTLRSRMFHGLKKLARMMRSKGDETEEGKAE